MNNKFVINYEYSNCGWNVYVNETFIHSFWFKSNALKLVYELKSRNCGPNFYVEKDYNNVFYHIYINNINTSIAKFFLQRNALEVTINLNNAYSELWE